MAKRRYNIKNRRKWLEIRRKATQKMWKNPEYRKKQSIAQSRANLRSWKDPMVRRHRIKGLTRGQRQSYADPIVGALRRHRLSISQSSHFANMSVSERSKACAHWHRASFNAKSNTRLEKTAQSLLRRAKIKFRGHKRIGRFVPDIFIKPKLCIFVDGTYWHCRPERKKSDRRISRTLQNMGYLVVRLSEKVIQSSPSKCVKIVTQSLKRG